MTTSPPTTKTTPRTPRPRRPPAVGGALRAPRLVTAAEVAGATGLSLSAIVEGIKQQRIPGKGVRNETTFGRRTRWYVNIRQYIAACGRTAPSTMRRALWQLSKTTDNDEATDVEEG